MVVSDGSAKENQMSYGWVINSLDDEPIAKGYGRCNGRPTSMRAESAGMLAATIFLSTIQKFTNGSLGTLQAKYFTDNQALITRMNHHQQFVEPFVNTHLIPDYDLTEEIYMLQQRHNIKVTFSHVKGHLDDKHELATLAQEERMNVEADALATLYYEKGQPSSPK